MFRAPESGRLDKSGNAEFVKNEDGEWEANFAFVYPEEGRMDEFGEMEFIDDGNGNWVENPDFDADNIETDPEAGRVDANGNYEFGWNYTLGKWIPNPDFVDPDDGNDPEDPDKDEFDPEDPDSPNVPAGYVWCEGPQMWIEQPTNPSDKVDADGEPEYVWDGSLVVPAWVLNPNYTETVVTPDPEEPTDEFDPKDPNAENVPEGYVWCEGPEEWILQPANPSTDIDEDGNPEYIWDGSLDVPAWVLNPDYNAGSEDPTDEFDPTDPDADAPEGWVWCEGPQKWVEQPPIPDEWTGDDDIPLYIWDGSLDEPAWVINPDFHGPMPGDEEIEIDDDETSGGTLGEAED